jgi:maleylacetate reductase
MEAAVDWAARGFRWREGPRLVCFGRGLAGQAAALLHEERLAPFALFTTPRAAAALPQAAAAAALVVHVSPGPVPEAALAAEWGLLLAERLPTALVALGGGRVLDACKAVAAAHGLPWAAVPTTLSGAEMSAFHRPLADGRGAAPAPARLVLNDPALSASQPAPALTASALNAFGHAMEALYVPGATPLASLAAVEAVRLLARGLEAAQGAAAGDPAGRDDLALAALLAGYAIGVTGLGPHHVLCQSIVRGTSVPHATAYAVMGPVMLAAMVRAAPRELAPLVLALSDSGESGEAVTRLARLAAAAGVTRLGQAGVGEQDLTAVAALAAARPELSRSPAALDEGGALALLRAAL